MSRVQTFQPEPSFPAAQTVAPERVPLHLRDSFLGRRQIRCLRSATRQKTETYSSWKISFWPPPGTISTGLSSVWCSIYQSRRWTRALTAAFLLGRLSWRPLESILRILGVFRLHDREAGFSTASR